MRIWKILALGGILAAATAAFVFAEEQPPYSVRDRATSENFRTIFYSVDQLTSGITRIGSNNSILCLSSPLLCLDSTNQRVGIGTATPSFPLDLYVSGTRAFSIDTSRQFAFTGRNNTVTNTNDGNTLVSITNDSTGVSALSSVFVNNNTANSYLRQYGTNFTGTLFGITQANYGIVENSSGGAGLMFNTLAATPMVFGTNSTEALRIGSTQRVGIGTATPATKLHLSSGVLTIDGTTSGISVSTITGLSGNTVRISTFGATTSSIEVLANGSVTVIGSKTNGSGCTGCVGEFITSYQFINMAFAATGLYDDLTSISLSPGDWDVWINHQGDAGTGATLIEVGISTQTGNAFTDLARGNNATFVPIVGAGGTGAFLQIQVKVPAGSNVVYYFKRFATYVTTAPNSRGTISARRAR